MSEIHEFQPLVVDLPKIEASQLADPHALIGKWLTAHNNAGIILFGENNHFTPGVLALEPPLVDFLDRNPP